MKFGLFIHWGPISLQGAPIGWSRGGERRGWRGKGHVPVEVYDNLYKRFNPVEFNADEWVQMAKDAGMKYLVFAGKHHDGFWMFDSKLTDYKITNSPFKRDVFRELADACHKAGLKLGFYYSLPDWYHPDYRTENHDRYIEYMHGQVREICSNYGKIDIVWLDGMEARPRIGTRQPLPDDPPTSAARYHQQSRRLARRPRTAEQKVGKPISPVLGRPHDSLPAVGVEPR